MQIIIHYPIYDDDSGIEGKLNAIQLFKWINELHSCILAEKSKREGERKWRCIYAIVT